VLSSAELTIKSRVLGVEAKDDRVVDEEEVLTECEERIEEPNFFPARSRLGGLSSLAFGACLFLPVALSTILKDGA